MSIWAWHYHIIIGGDHNTIEAEPTPSVYLNTDKSAWEEVWSGVPQGSVLGPLLFLIYINELEEEVVSKVFKFADDTKLFRQDSDTVDAVGMQEDLDRLVEWADKWQMQFNVSKCKVLK